MYPSIQYLGDIWVCVVDWLRNWPIKQTHFLTQASWKGFNNRLQLSDVQSFPEHPICSLHLWVQVEPTHTHPYTHINTLVQGLTEFTPNLNLQYTPSLHSTLTLKLKKQRSNLGSGESRDTKHVNKLYIKVEFYKIWLKYPKLQSDSLTQLPPLFPSNKTKLLKAVQQKSKNKAMKWSFQRNVLLSTNPQLYSCYR